jgi:hypothetical protein
MNENKKTGRTTRPRKTEEPKTQSQKLRTKWSLGDHLGAAGLVVALAAVAASSLWPEERSVGAIALILAAVVLLLWWIWALSPKLRFKRAWIVKTLVALLIVAAFSHLFYQARDVDCLVSTSHVIVSREYAEGKFQGLGESTAPYTSRELFYEWTFILESPKRIKQATAVINNLTIKDRISNNRTTGVEISDFSPRWMSGFGEEEERSPDYYSKTIKFSDIPKGQEQTISIRRKILGFPLNTFELIRLFDLSSPSCRISKPRFDGDFEATLLNKELYYIGTTWPMPLRDLSDMPPGQFGGTVERRCAWNGTIAGVGQLGFTCTIRDPELRIRPGKKPSK